MKMLALLSIGNLAFLPAGIAIPGATALAAVTVMAVAAAWLLWPVAELIGAAIE